MPSTVRQRNRIEMGPSGSIEFNGVTDSSERTVLEAYVKDIVNVPPQSGALFEVESFRSYGGFFNSEGYGRKTTNWTPLAFRDTSGFRHLPIPSRPTDSALVTRLLARANPESTQLNVPLFLFELRELPALLKQAKELIVQPRPRSSIPAGLGSLWLQAQFGWKPFLSDLWSYITLADSISKRVETFRKIQTNKGKPKTVKRKLLKGKTTKSYYQNFANSALLVVDAYVEIETRYEISGYAKFLPKSTLPTTDAELIQKAKDTYFGLNLRPSDLWDAFPWTWMIDYFVNVGDYIAANQGMIYFTMEEYALMENQTTVLKAKFDTFIPTPDPYVNVHESKRRFKPPISIDANFDAPFLSAYQASILGSLLLTR